MPEYVDQLKVLLASTISLKYKAQGYHWNVEGRQFFGMHNLFEEIYESIDELIDPLAEWIRMSGDYAPFTLARFIELSFVKDSIVSSDPLDMARDLLSYHIMSAKQFGDLAEVVASSGEKGLENFLSAAMETHQKWVWMLGSVVKDGVER